MLKRIDDLTESELLDLTDEQVEKFIEIEAAYEGIVPVDAPGEKPKPPEIKKTVKAFKVGDLIFMDQEEAGRVATMESLRKSNYNYSGAGYDYKWLDITDNYGVEVVWFYNREEVLKLDTELKLHKIKSETWKTQNNKYSNYQKDLEGIRNTVWEPIIEARRNQASINHAREVYVNHLKLAEGNQDIAANFFRKAYQDDPEILMAVLGEEEPAVAVSEN